MKRGTSNHPKTGRLMLELGINRREATGLLQMLWEWTGDFAIQGDIGRWSNVQIAEAIGWEPAQADKLVRALLDSGWIDESKLHRLVIHDWEQHCEEYIRKRLKRQGLEFAKSGGQRRTTAAVGRQRQPTADNGSLPSPSQPSPSMPCHAKPEAVLPPELDTVAFGKVWAEWQQHRREKKSAMTPTATKSQLKKLQEMGHDRAIAAINHSIANSWTGIFEPDSRAGGGNHRNQAGTAATQRRADEAGRLLGGGSAIAVPRVAVGS